MIQKSTRGLEYVIARAPLIKRAYWKWIPRYYRHRISNRIDHTPPLDPLKIVWVSPDKIERFSGRENAKKDRYLDIGKVQAGDWDQNGFTQSDSQNKIGLFALDHSQYITDTTMYNSYVEHFKFGVRWEKTRIFDMIYEKVQNNDDVWRGSKSKEDILQRMIEIDSVHDKIKNERYKTQLQLMADNGVPSDRVGYLDLLTDEITVDVSRTGELLFVDGRHRLCIAKILQLDEIPVVILARHRKWLDQRQNLWSENKDNFNRHPDTIEFNQFYLTDKY